MPATYVTFDEVSERSGAGKVCFHETNALKKVAPDLKIIHAPDLPSPEIHRYNPFLRDYFAAQLIKDRPQFMHLSCSPGLAILDRAQPQKYVVNVVAHDLNESIKEFELFYGAGTYPFIHNVDPYLHELLLRHTENAEYIICPSKSAAKWISENIHYHDNVEIIPHGCYKPNKVTPIPSDKFITGYLGAHGPDKGLIYLLNANASFYLEQELVFAGTCCNDITKLPGGMAPNIKLLGWVDDIEDFYNSITVYVQPSVTEGFGIEILEAMAHARPVIASLGAGGADLIEDGITGFVVPPRDPKAIIDRLQILYKNRDRAISMGLHGMLKAQEYYWDKIEERYVKLYSRFI